MDNATDHCLLCAIRAGFREWSLWPSGKEGMFFLRRQKRTWAGIYSIGLPEGQCWCGSHVSTPKRALSAFAFLRQNFFDFSPLHSLKCEGLFAGTGNLKSWRVHCSAFMCSVFRFLVFSVFVCACACPSVCVCEHVYLYVCV